MRLPIVERLMFSIYDAASGLGQAKGNSLLLYTFRDLSFSPESLKYKLEEMQEIISVHF